MIELKQLNKSYHVNNQTFHALQDIDLSIARGEIFGILGKSGVGKSTLLRCVNLLERPTSGQILVNGVDLTSLSAKQLRAQRHNIGIIFQHFNLLESRTTFDNIALPLEIIGKTTTEIRRKVMGLLDLVGLQNRQNHYPAQLSGGQKQRVAIARALATDPQVLLSDEATSSLDTESTKSILSLLKKINVELGLTILLITHELDVVKQICDEVAVLEQGRLVEQGSTIEVLINPQNPITKQLVQKGFHLPSATYMATTHHEKGTLLVQLIFLGHDSDEPLISNLVRNFPVTVNIRQAQIEKIKDTTVGFTICEITGDEATLEQVLQYIQSTSIKVEILYHG